MKNWSIISDVVLSMFANNLLTGDQLYRRYKNTEHGGAVRNLLREKKVSGARKLARMALRRRKSTTPIVGITQ